MKQHITQEQLNELSIEAYSKLGDWLSKGEQFKTRDLLLCIGQMVEFLEEEFNTTMSSWQTWTVTLDQGKFNKTEKRFVATELCDALWEATKEVLEI